MEKNMEKNAYTCITESLPYKAEIAITLWINYISAKIFLKKEQYAVKLETSPHSNRVHL